ncbi:MAG: tandem-95 repeat protein, partial [Gammaproteobacteria bacterium]|nr:tandem-95 repeat protein [Gammaproteobacteria bacterium]
MTTNVVANDHGSSLSVTNLTNGSNGTTVNNGDGTVTYTPDDNFSGVDTYTYTVDDGTSTSNTATVTVTVAPVAVDDEYNTAFETPLTVPAGTGVLVGDFGSSLSVQAPRPISGPSNGTLTLNADGSFTYTPSNGFAGDDTFTYKATDGTSDSNTATVTIHVAPPAGPVATDKNAVTTAGSPSGSPVTTNVMAGDTGYNISLTSITNGTNGTTVDNGDGTVTYTPDDNFSGVDTYTYTITDGFGRTSTATVTVTVTPVAVNDTASTTAGSPTGVPVTTNVVANDHGSSLSVTNLTNGSNGTTVNNGHGTVTYTPGNNFSGVDTYTYTVNDGTSTSNTATVTVTVTPTAVDDLTSTGPNTPIDIDVLANDHGTSLTVQSVTAPPSGGTATIVANEVRYTPPFNFSGYDVFPYTISDGYG